MIDRDEIARALSLLLAPGQVAELRILKWGKAGVTISGYFNDPAALLAAVIQRDRESNKGVYMTLNPVNDALLARAHNRADYRKDEPSTGDQDITCRRWLPIDCDPVRPSGISSSDDEHAHALARIDLIRDTLIGMGWPEPIVADSGNGGHLLFRVDIPRDDGGLVEKVLKALAFRFDDDHVTIDQKVFNPARIWKLYGTTSAKGDSTSARPHRMARILTTPDRLEPVHRADLETLAATLPAPPADPRPATGPAFDLDDWIVRHNLDVTGPTAWNGGRRWIFRVCPWNPDHTNRSAYVLEFPSGAVAAGCQHNGCADRKWTDLRELYEPGFRDRLYPATATTQQTLPSPTERLTPPPSERSLPCDVGAEEAVIASCLRDGLAFTKVAFLQPADFSQEKHRMVWGALRALWLESRTLDEVTVAHELNDRGWLESVGGRSFLERIVGKLPSGDHVGRYAGIVIDTARRRRLIQQAERLIVAARDGGDVTGQLENLVAVLTESGRQKEPRLIADLLDDYAETLDAFERDPKSLQGILTGITSLDRATRGLQPGELTILGASTSIGKSQFALTVAKYVGLHTGLVLFYSLEMGEYSLLERLIAQAAGVNINGIVNFGWTTAELAAWRQWRRDLRPLKIGVLDSPTQDTAMIRATFHRWKIKHPDTQFAVIDYLDIIENKGDNEPLRRGEITRAIRALARDFNVHVLMLCQLNRGPEVGRRRPTRADLKWSNQIAEVADNVILLHKPDQEEKKPANAFTVIIDKQRRGPTTAFDIEFVRETGQIGDALHAYAT